MQENKKMNNNEETALNNKSNARKIKNDNRRDPVTRTKRTKKENTRAANEENNNTTAELIKKSNMRKKVNANNSVQRQTKRVERTKSKDTTGKKDFRFKSEKLKIIPLGGIEEIGKNITVFEYGEDIIIVDCGLAFPEDDMLGIDLVIPDFTYLEKNKEKIKGLVITHGHEDHIGAIPYLLSKINIPIYATKLTAGLISHKLEEHKLLRSTKLKTVNQGQTIVLGKMRVEFIRSCHSIPDAVALAIHTPAGIVVHTGDFKIDYTPIDDEKMDFCTIKK